MQEKLIPDPLRNIPKKPSRSRTRKIIYWAGGSIIFILLAAWIVLSSYPNTVVHYVIEPKLKQLVVDRLGRRYSLQMTSITLSENKDSLILTGVRITDNGKTDEGSSDTSELNFGVATPLDRLTTDTVMIAGLDYWKLIFQKGLFSERITIRSPKIYLRPGALPKFAENTDLFPSFLPAVSSKIINVENAEVYFTDAMPHPVTDHSPAGGVRVKKASLEFRDFFLDEPTYKKAVSTFFCKNATFHAEEVSHIDSTGRTDLSVSSVDGNLIDSLMDVYDIEGTKPLEEIKRFHVAHVGFAGLDWYSALAGHGLHGRKVAVERAQIYLQNVEDMKPHPQYHFAGSDLMPLPTLLPDVMFADFQASNAEIYAVLPQTHTVSSLKRIHLSLDRFRLDPTTPFTNISGFFSQNAEYGIDGESVLTTSVGKLQIGQIRGANKSLSLSKIALAPSVKGLKQATVKSMEIIGLDLWKVLMREGFFASTVNVHEPGIDLEKSFTTPITSLDSVLEYDPLVPIREFKEYPMPLLLPVAHIGTITVSNGFVRGVHLFDDPKSPSARGDSLTGLGISLRNFKLDKNSWTRSRGMLFSESGSFTIGAMTQHTDGYHYSYSEGGIKGDLRKHTISIDSVLIHPLLPEEEFGAAFKYRTERISFFAPRIDVSGIDYQKLFSGNGIFADSLYVNNWKMHVYGDRRRPEDLQAKVSKYPHELFQQIKVPLTIGRMSLRDGEFSFRESWPDTTVPGTIPLRHVNLQIGAVSNNRSIAGDSLVTAIEGNLMVMDAGPVNFTIGYQLLNPQFRLDINGRLGGIDASLFNEYLAHTEPFTLTGTVRSADFSLHLNGNLITGTIVPQYDSLHVTFFRWDKFPPGLVSFLANAIFMRSHNIPELDHPLHRAEISAVLEPTVNLFWGLWLPIRNGIGSIVRIPEWVW